MEPKVKEAQAKPKSKPVVQDQTGNCIKCLKGSLQEYTMPKSGMTIDQCNACGGMWFDPGELETILGPNAVQPFFISGGSNVNDEYHCPRCSVPLAAFNYSGTSTEIDACPSCKGIWLDYKEWHDISAARKGR